MRHKKLLSSTFLPALLLFYAPFAQSKESKVAEYPVARTFPELVLSFGQDSNPVNQEIQKISDDLLNAKKDSKEEKKAVKQIFRLEGKVVKGALATDQVDKGIYYSVNEANVKKHANPVAKATVTATHALKRITGFFGTVTKKILKFPGTATKKVTDSVSEQIEKADDVVPHAGTMMSFPFKSLGCAIDYVMNKLGSSTDQIITNSGAFAASTINTASLLATGEFQYAPMEAINAAGNALSLGFVAADIALNVATDGLSTAVEFGVDSLYPELKDPCFFLNGMTSFVLDHSQTTTDQKTTTDKNISNGEKSPTTPSLKETIKKSSLEGENTQENTSPSKEKTLDNAQLSQLKAIDYDH